MDSETMSLSLNILKILQHSQENTCGEHFFKKDSATGFSQNIFWNFKKTFSPGDCFWEFTSLWLLWMLFRITGLKDFAKFPNKFLRTMKFFFKELFFSSKNLIRNNCITGIF